MSVSQSKEASMDERVGICVRVEPGACGYVTTVSVYRAEADLIRVSVESECNGVQRWIENLGAIDPRALLCPKGAGRFLSGALEALPHITCPIPLGILRAVEILAGAALPSVAVIRTESYDRLTT